MQLTKEEGRKVFHRRTGLCVARPRLPYFIKKVLSSSLPLTKNYVYKEEFCLSALPFKLTARAKLASVILSDNIGVVLAKAKGFPPYGPLPSDRSTAPGMGYTGRRADLTR